MAPELVLLHGFTHTGASWSPVISRLGERYLALAPDIRGHGTASDAEPLTLDAVIADVLGLTTGRLTLCGYSMGGRIALQVACSDPARVERLVLIGASPGIDDSAERATRRAADEQLAAEIEHVSIEEFAERWSATPVLAGQPASVRAAVREDRLRNTTAGLARALRGLGTGVLPPLWDRLEALGMPVSLIVGERDEKFQRIAEAMIGSLPDARLVIVPSAGHAVHLEAPDAVARVIAGS